MLSLSSWRGIRRLQGCGPFRGYYSGGKSSWRLVKELPIPEFSLHGTKYVHPLGATAVHLDASDTNCVFSIGFRTFPTDSTGVPHILEHLSLCGSHRYPVRDPFFKMLSRSLASYMNAWTAADWTMYPFATQNPADFSNLRNIYLDATLRPLLKEQDFRQEGWRVQRRPNDPSQWEITGVVYNEMKGVLSDAEALFATRFQQAMLAGSIYGNVSGGDPPFIPSLSHDQLVAFYRGHYHPGNSLVVSYGRLPNLHEHLELLHEKFAEASPSDVTPSSLSDPMQGFQRFTSPRRIVTTAGAIDPSNDPARQVKAIQSFLCNPLSDAQTTFNMALLANLLLDGPAAPLYQALIDSNMGNDYAPGTGYDSHTPVCTFSVGLQGIKAEDVERMEGMIQRTLERIHVEGIPEERVEAALHQLELGIRYHSANFGLGLAQKATSAWTHNLCPLESISLANKIEKFRQQYASGGLFEGYIEEFMLKNAHQLTFVMKPLPDYLDSLKKAEHQVALDKTSSLSSEDIKELDSLNEALRTAQDAKDCGKELLPCLTLSDVNPLTSPQPYVVTKTANGCNQYVRITEKANGMGYFRLKMMLPKLEEEEISLLPLLTNCLTELGVASMPIDVFDRVVREHCAGLSVSVHQERPVNAHDCTLSLMLSSHALPDKIPKMFELFELALRETNWSDTQRLKTQVTGIVASMSNSVASSGHSFALSKAASTLSAHRKMAERLSGLEQLQFMNSLLTTLEQEGQAALKRLSLTLAALTKKLFKGKQVLGQAFISATQSTNDGLMVGTAKLIESLGGTGLEREAEWMQLDPTLIAPSRQVIPMPFSTNFTAQAFNTYPSNVEDVANLAILARLLRPLRLHPEIREKGGAYGGGASYSVLDGVFNFYSYRDPTPLRSVEVFDNVAQWLEEAEISPQDLLEAKLSVFSDLDAPQSINSEGLYHFLHNITDEERQERRDALFLVDLKSLKSVARRHLAAPRSTCIIADNSSDVQTLQKAGFASA